MTPPFFLYTMKRLVVSIIMFLILLYFVIQQCFQGQHHDVGRYLFWRVSVFPCVHE